METFPRCTIKARSITLTSAYVSLSPSSQVSADQHVRLSTPKRLEVLNPLKRNDVLMVRHYRQAFCRQCCVRTLTQSKEKVN